MEKQRIKSNSKSCKRLLILICSLLYSSGLFAQVSTKAKLEPLRINPVEDQQLFTNTNIKFEVVVPDFRPVQIDITTPEDTAYVAYKTIRRTENFGDEGGTKIEIWTTFSKAGTYTLKPLAIRIRNFNYQLQFNPVVINVNPQELVPEVVLEFSNGIEVSSSSIGEGKNPVFEVKTGDKLKFRLNLKYAVQLVQFSWEIPKDSIFTQLKTYEITEMKYRDKTYSENLIPVADFEWISLVPGKVTLPEFYITATGYNGRKTDVKMPKAVIQVVQKNGVTTTSNNEKFLDSAFDFSDNVYEKDSSKDVTREVCMRLASLRKNERISITRDIKKQREELEKEYNLPSTQNEFSIIILFISAILVVFFAFLLIIFIRKGIVGANILTGVLELCAIILLVVCIVKAKKDYAVSLGCKIYSIPEISAGSQTEIPAGNRVLIKESVDDWCYVELGETGGWCKDSEILVIK